MLFEARGDRVRIAYDGVEALAAEEAFRPDTILLDIGMPRLSGYEVARRVRELRGDSVLIVAITGWGQEQDRLRAKQAGFDHHFTKPVEIASLMEIIDRRNA